MPGTQRKLTEHGLYLLDFPLFWEQGAGGSNPSAPTTKINHLRKVRTSAWDETWDEIKPDKRARVLAVVRHPRACFFSYSGTSQGEIAPLGTRSLSEFTALMCPSATRTNGRRLI